MEITAKIHIREDADPADILLWLQLGKRLGASAPSLRASEHVHSYMPGPVDVQTAVSPEAINEQLAADTIDEEQQQADNAPSGALPPGVEPEKKKRGRKPSKTADQQANAAADPPVQPAQPAAPNGFQLPPGVTGATSTGASPPPGAHPAAAMPPAHAGANGDEMLLEDFKAEAMTLHGAAQSRGLTAAYPFNVIRAQTWPDGSPKPFNTMNMDTVPADQRRAVLDHIVRVLSQ